jgi:hypothetical protein
MLGLTNACRSGQATPALARGEREPGLICPDMKNREKWIPDLGRFVLGRDDNRAA